MLTETRAHEAVRALSNYREEHPIRTRIWGALGIIGVQGEDGIYRPSVGVSDRGNTLLAPFRTLGMESILAGAGLDDVTVHSVDVHPAYLDPNYGNKS